MGIFNWFKKRDKPSEKIFPDIACPKCKVLNKDSAIRCRYCNYEFPLIPQEEYDPTQNAIKIFDQTSVKESKVEISSQELRKQSENALEQKEIDNAVHLAFLARGKELPELTENTPFDIICDFEWGEFDKFYKLFEGSGKWPYLWDKIEKYAYLQKCTIKELLYELNKKQLFEIAEKYSVKLKKSYKIDMIIDALVNNIPEHDRSRILEIVNQKLKPKFLDAKRFLLTHTLSMYFSNYATIKEINKAHEEVGVIIEKIEILPADTTCFICKEMGNKKFNIDTLKKENIPPFHPGCRCTILPFSESWE